MCDTISMGNSTVSTLHVIIFNGTILLLLLLIVTMILLPSIIIYHFTFTSSCYCYQWLLPLSLIVTLILLPSIITVATNYIPCMRRGNVFVVPVCVSVCQSVCLFEPVDITGSRSRSSHGKCQLCYPDISLTWFDLSEVKIINDVKVIVRSRSFQGQIVSV